MTIMNNAYGKVTAFANTTCTCLAFVHVSLGYFCLVWRDWNCIADIIVRHIILINGYIEYTIPITTIPSTVSVSTIVPSPLIFFLVGNLCFGIFRNGFLWYSAGFPWSSSQNARGKFFGILSIPIATTTTSVATIKTTHSNVIRPKNFNTKRFHKRLYAILGTTVTTLTDVCHGTRRAPKIITFSTFIKTISLFHILGNRIDSIAFSSRLTFALWTFGNWFKDGYLFKEYLFATSF
mmetsp:Transcript_13390/g.19151  ORF Transcript_13390/g.19151 Transcript_13390/m.19151 type:complete len:236 (+) Transcript_13390:537-1244(+)